MPRSFNGSSHKVRFSNPPAVVASGGFCMAAILNMNDPPDQWRSVITAMNSTATAVQGYAMEFENSATALTLEVTDTSGVQVSGASVVPRGVWVMVAVAHAPGAANWRLYVYNFSTNSWSTDGTTFGSSTTLASNSPARLEFGGDFGGAGDWFEGLYHIGAVWAKDPGANMIHALPFTLQAWLGADACVLYDQATGQPMDLSGRLAYDSSLSALPTISTTSVPVWNYIDQCWEVQRTPAGGGTGFTQNLGGSIDPAGALVKAVQKQLGGPVSPAGALTKGVGKLLAGSSSPSGAHTKAVGKRHGGATSPAGALTRAVGKVLGGATSPSGSLVKAVKNFLAGVTSPSGALGNTTSGGTAFTQNLGGAISPTGTLVKAVGKSLGGASSPSGALRKAVSLTRAGSTSPSGTLRKAVAKNLAGACSPTGSLAKAIAKRFSGAIAPAGALVQQVFSGGGAVLRGSFDSPRPSGGAGGPASRAGGYLDPPGPRGGAGG